MRIVEGLNRIILSVFTGSHLISKSVQFKYASNHASPSSKIATIIPHIFLVVKDLL